MKPTKKDSLVAGLEVECEFRTLFGERILAKDHLRMCPRFEQMHHLAAGQSGRVAFTKDREALAIEPDQSVQRAEPEVTITRLGDGEDGALGEALLGQALVGAPVIHDERVGPGGLTGGKSGPNDADQGEPAPGCARPVPDLADLHLRGHELVEPAGDRTSAGVGEACPACAGEASVAPGDGHRLTA